MIARHLQQTFLIWLSCAGLAGTAADSTPDKAAEPQYRVTRWTAENRLPQNTITALAQTRDGYLWIGTLYGLARFDGVKFESFNHGNTPEMVSDSINDLAVDQGDGSLWVATGHSLLRYYEHRFEKVDVKREPYVGKLWAARKGGFWFSPRFGQLSLFQNGKIESWEVLLPAADNDVMQVLEEDVSHVKVLARGSVWRLNLISGAKTEIDLPPDKSPAAWVSSFMEAEDSLWITCPAGIWRQKDGAWTRLTTADPLRWPHPDGINRISDGAIWVNLREDNRRTLQRLVGSRLDPVMEVPPGLSVGRWLQDREGSIWAGSSHGLFRLRRNHLRIYSTVDGLRNDDVLAVAMGPDDSVWAGTERGFSVIRKDVVQNLPPFPSGDPGRGAIFSLDHTGRVWTYYPGVGLMVFDGEAWTHHSYLAAFGQAYCSALHWDNDQRLWMALGERVFSYDRGAWTEHGTDTAGTRKSVRVIFQDRRHDIWLGTFGGGLHLLRNGRITSYATKHGDYNNRAWSIHEDVDGIFWVGSQNGLNRFVPPGVRGNHPDLLASTATNEGHFFTFTTQHGLRDVVVNNIQEDEFGYLWLSGVRGIYRVSREKLNEVALGKTDEVEVLELGEADGMLSSECNGGDNQPAGCKDALGRIYFPTKKGVVMIDPKAIHLNDVPPPVVIEQVIVDDEIISGHGTAAIQLGPGRAQLVEIRYTANTFVAPDRVRFKFRLEGNDAKWRWDNDNRRVAFYHNLRPGDYKFRVMACNNHGVWNETAAGFAFSLAPKFTQTLWFPLLCVAGLLAGSGGLGLWRLRWQRRLLKFEEQQALAHERTRIARDLHDDLGTALTGLALELDVIRRDTPRTTASSNRLGETAQRTRELAERMREVVWAVNPRCDSVSSLASFLEQQTAQFLHSDGISGRLEFPDEIPDLPLDSETRHQLTLAVREALSNVVRHAAATQVMVRMKIEENILILVVADNGCGFSASPQIGHGLGNLRERLAKIGGEFTYRSAPGNGAALTFRVPLGSSTGYKERAQP